MDVSRGRCLVAPLRKRRNWTQSELSRRTGYDPKLKPAKLREGYSQRMISHFERYDGKGTGRPMDPEAMYVIRRALGVENDDLYMWNVIGAIAE